MADLAKLVVKLEAQTAQYQKKLETSDKRLKRFEKNTKKSLTRVATSFKTILGGVAIGAFVRKVSQATAAQENAVKQLEQGLVSTGNVVGQSLDELTKKAAELQKVTTFGDEDIIAAQSQLVTFTNVAGQQFDRTLEAALDLSARMDQDLKSAVVQLGKALNDPIANLSALSRIGIQFSESQKDIIKELIKTNRLAEAQDVILQELERQFGGSAKAARDTLGGALDSLGNAFGDLFEAADSTEAQDSIEEFTALLQDPKVIAGIQAMTSAVVTLIGAFVKLGAAATNAVGDFAEGVARYVSGAGDIKGAVSEVADSFKRNQFNGFFDEKTFNKNKEFLEQLAPFAGAEKIEGELKRVKGLISDIQELQSKEIGSQRVQDNIDRQLKGYQEILGVLEKAARINAPIVDQPTAAKVGTEKKGQMVSAPSIVRDSSAADAIAKEEKRLNELAATITESVIPPLVEFQRQEAELDLLLARNSITQDTYNAKLSEYKEALAAATPGIGSMVELNEALNNTLPPQAAALAQVREQISDLVEAMALFPEKSDAIGLAIQNLRADEYELLQTTKETEEGLSLFAERAAENIQDQLGTTIRDSLSGDFDGILASWGNMLAEMGSQAIAAKLAEQFDIKGLLSSGSGGGGGLGDFFGGFFADGGRPNPGKVSVVGEEGPELFVPDGVSGRIVPNGAMGGSSLSVGQVVFPGVSNEKEAKRAAGAFAREVSRTVQNSGRYR